MRALAAARAARDDPDRSALTILTVVFLRRVIVGELDREGAHMEKHLVAIGWGVAGALLVTFATGRGFLPQFLTGGIVVQDVKTGRQNLPKIPTP